MTAAEVLPHHPELGDALAALAPVGLAELVEHAAALHRVDRKYVVPVALARRVLAALAADHAVLDIGGRRGTAYRSTYLDTDRLSSCRDHVQGRRRRWKARSRLYVEDHLCRVEVKVRSTRGSTSKLIARSTPQRYGSCGPDEVDFVHGVLDASGFAPPGLLTPSMEVAYRRSTLAHLGSGVRITIDTGVTGTAVGRPGRRVLLDPAFAVVETKGGARPGVADRMLLAAGHRPRPFSKYVATASLLRDDVPANDVHHLVGRVLHVTTTDEES